MLKTITVKKLLNELSNIQLIDIREPYEVEEGYIQKSINIPMGGILEKVDQLNKTKKVVIYCNTGRRSKPVVYMLKKLHNISAYDLEGGYKNYLNFLAK